MATATSSYFTKGRCQEVHTVRDGYKYEAKVFPTEDAMFLARETFAQTQILRHNRISGEVSTQGDRLGRYVTFHEDVKPGWQKRLYRDDIVSNGWVSKANGYCPTLCGWAPTGTKRDIQIDKSLQTVAVAQKEDICMNEFLGTWRHSELARGMQNHGDDIFISDAIFFAFEKVNIQNIDRHFWAGNYQSGDPLTTHVDGVIKMAVQMMNNQQDWILQYNFTGLAAGMFIEGAIGAAEFSVPFNTSDTQTIDDLITEITDGSKYFSAEDYTDLISSATRAGTALTVQTPSKLPYPLQLLITDGSGVCFDLDGQLIPEGTAVTAATITTTTVQEAMNGESPIGIRKETITQNNVLSKIEELMLEIHANKPEMLDFAYGLNLFVAPNVWIALKLALKKLNQQFTGDVSLGIDDELRDICGFRRIIKANYMPANEMFAARPQDLHVATDLLSDILNTETGYDRKCELAWFRNVFALGFLISDGNNVAGTFCGRPAGEFTAAMDYSLC